MVLSHLSHQAIQGSGADGIIRAADVEGAHAPAPAPAVTVAAPVTAATPVVAMAPPVVAPDGSFTEIPLTNMRKAIAKRLTHSTQVVIAKRLNYWYKKLKCGIIKFYLTFI